MTGATEWFLLEGDAEIDTIGRHAATSVHPNRMLPFWVLAAVYAGQRTFKLNGRAYRASAGDYYLLPPGIPHEGGDLETYDLFYVHFRMPGGPHPSPDSGGTLDGILLPVTGRLPKERDVLSFMEYFERQYRLGRFGPDFYPLQLKALLSQISVSTRQSRLESDPKSALAEEILDFLVQRHSGELNADVLEKRFFRSYRQLNDTFKARFSVTIKQKVIDLRIQHAFNLLINGESLSTVVSQTGFTDYFYFLKCFKQKKGISPKELQKKYLLRDSE